MNRLIVSVIGAALLVGIGAYMYTNLDSAGPQTGETPDVANESMRTYTSPNTGLTLTYPDKYFLEEKNIGSPQRGRFTIVLMEDTAENKAVREGTGPAREGPPTITIDMFQNNLDSYTADSWIRGTNDSNYKLSSNRAIATTSINAVSARSYRWSGLYEGETRVVARPDWLYAFSVTWLTPDDALVSDFEKILSTVQF